MPGFEFMCFENSNMEVFNMYKSRENDRMNAHIAIPPFSVITSSSQSWVICGVCRLSKPGFGEWWCWVVSLKEAE